MHLEAIENPRRAGRPERREILDVGHFKVTFELRKPDASWSCHTTTDLRRAPGAPERQRDLSARALGALKPLSSSVLCPLNSAQNNLSKQLDLLYTNLEKEAFTEFAPSTWQQLEEMGISGSVRGNLVAAIRDVFEGNQITPATALDELDAICTRFKEAESAVSRLVASFEFLGVGAEELVSGECELGVLIPRGAVQNQLLGLGSEFQVIAKAVGPFAEIATGTRPPLEVSSIASTDFMTFLKLAVPIGTAIAIAIERLTASYKSILEIRKLHRELREQDVPDDALEDVRKYAEQRMRIGIDEIVVDFMENRCVVKDAGRANELRTELRSVLRQLAARIDKGYNFEIRVGAASGGNVELGEALPDAEQDELQRVSKSLRFLHLEGEGILSLPEPAQEDSEEEAT